MASEKYAQQLKLQTILLALCQKLSRLLNPVTEIIIVSPKSRHFDIDNMLT